MKQTKLLSGVFPTVSQFRSSMVVAMAMSAILVSLSGCHDPSVELAAENSSATTHGEPEHSEIASAQNDHVEIDHSEATRPHGLVDASNGGHGVSAESTQDHELEQEPGVLGKAGDLLKKATAKGGATAKGAGKWVQEKLGSATEAGGQTAEDTMNWANETFEMLKAKGLTTASDTSQWLSEDWTNMQSWEYKIVTMEDSDEELAKSLNELGKQGWECFETQERPGGTRFFFKKPTFSYLRHLPFNDLIKLAPLMNNDQK